MIILVTMLKFSELSQLVYIKLKSSCKFCNVQPEDMRRYVNVSTICDLPYKSTTLSPYQNNQLIVLLKLSLEQKNLLFQVLPHVH